MTVCLFLLWRQSLFISSVVNEIMLIILCINILCIKLTPII